jgi:hypothetical protein
MQKQSLFENFSIRGIKILDIGYIAAMYFIIGLIASKLFDKLFGTFDPKKEDKKNIVQVGFELVGMIWLIGTSTYVVRNLAEFIPSPFDGIYGFKHSKVKELTSAAGYTLIVMGYAYHFRAKLEYFNKRLNGLLNLNSPVVDPKLGAATVLTAPQTIDNRQN